MGEYARSGAGGNVRFRSDFRQVGEFLTSTRSPLADELRVLGDQAAQALSDMVSDAYPTLADWHVQRRLTSNALFVSLVIADPNFKYREYDTEPHWPPFGKCTPLYFWAIVRGISPFYVAWKMAPTEPTGAKLTYCSPARGKSEVTMNMGGSGGRPSKRYAGTLVATAGKYAVTDGIGQIVYNLDDAINAALDRVWLKYERSL